jgi:UDP-N-acetylglucosamine 2-epimerase (non-hydrolysing)
MNDRAPRRIACVLGTRPEIVKMAPVVHALRAGGRATPLVVDTGQHRELVTETMAMFGLASDVALDLMQPGQRLAGFFGRCVEALDLALADLAVDAVAAQGDTSTMLAAALVAFYQRLPFFHVEAGLRTGHMRQPFPEEMNRTLASRLATVHFAPTQWAADNLRNEGIDDASIAVTGNTVIDALHYMRRKRVPHDVARTRGSRLIVVTAHRRENFGAPFERMLQALARIAATHPDVDIVYPAHPNPEVRRAFASVAGLADAIRIVEPLPYAPFVSLMDDAYLIITDSGGIQEEASALGKPVLVMRERTERPEAIAAGVARLVGSDADAIVEEASHLLDDADHYARMAHPSSPYGDGHAAARIAKRIVDELDGPDA